MKKLISILLMFFIACGPLFAEDPIISIRESELISIIETRVQIAVGTAVNAAVLKVVIEYEQKLLDKQEVIINTTAERDAALAEAMKFKELYRLEQLKSQSKILTYILIGVGAGLFGTGLGYGLSYIGK